MSEFTERPSEKPQPGDRHNGPQGFPIPPQPPMVYRESRGRSLAITLISSGIMAGLVAGMMVYGLDAFRANVKRQETLKQEGQVQVPKEGLEVYYPVPYESPPNLTFAAQMPGFVPLEHVVVEQKADHFKLRIKDGDESHGFVITWKAEGRPKK
jgi:hypothetical protein